MSDNTQLNPGAGGNVIADEEIGGVHYPKSKLVLGADGVDDGDVHAGNPLPVYGVMAQGLSAPPAFAWSVILSDGAAEYAAARASQLPGSLVGGRLDENLGSWMGSMAPTVGQKIMADSLPVALALDQSRLPVGVEASVLPTGAATETTVGKRFQGGKITGPPVVVTASGDTTVYAPAPGMTLTLYWAYLSSSTDNATETLVTVKLGSKTVYSAFLSAPGVFSHWEPVTADNAGDALVVHLSAGVSPGVAVNFTVTEG